ncbi:MAG: nucleotide exchange factor GrpE [Candidatus Hydrogenedentes bacterium]|jgi:molecular chaperone GrpE|nr:nucleotide exchange factor GrpE [Candidatus Hydrogenedentota bacterium]
MANTQQENTELGQCPKAEAVETDTAEPTEADAEDVAGTVEGEPTDAEDMVEGEVAEMAEAEEAPPVDRVSKLETEVVGLKDQLLRGRAEFDNYRKRVARDNERVRKMAAQGLIGDLLPALDNLELALQHKDDASGGLWEGVEMVSRLLAEILAARGLEPIMAEGAPFDPNVHEAVAQVPSEDVAEGEVVQEFQRGYMLGDQVLRPSKVTVSSGGVDESDESAGEV